jgi:3-oxoacyl-[acyl-carrier protein] reductase
MDLNLEGKCAVVCAASKGLGRAIAEALGREKARVLICARGEEELRKAA